MYLVELRPGKEELYRSTDELAAAIRSGDVDQHSRIYHRATSKWISVTLHPQFKAIVAAQPERPAEPPLPALERTSWTFFNAAAESLEGANAEDPAPEEPAEPQTADQPDDHPWRRPLALCVTGGFLILGVQLATSGPRPPWAGRDAKALPAPLSAARPASSGTLVDQDAGTISLASTRTSYTIRVPEYPPETAAAAAASVDSAPPLLPAAPRIRVSRALREALSRPTATAVEADAQTVTGLIARWSAAHDSARVRLESGIRVARLNQLFAPGRLTPNGGVTETRMSLAGLANFIRVFRQQQTAIDREYQDSFAISSRQLKWTPAAIRQWYAKPRQTEAPVLAGLTSSLMQGIDSLLGVLDAQAGSYTVSATAIVFEDPAAAREYTSLRQQIAATVDSAKAVGAATGSGPMTELLQVIGTTRLPQASS
jgi:hypothetical protein